MKKYIRFSIAFLVCVCCNLLTTEAQIYTENFEVDAGGWINAQVSGTRAFARIAGVNWATNGGASGSFRVPFGTTAHNTWALTPGITLTAGNTYRIEFGTRLDLANTCNNNLIEVRVGTVRSAAGMTAGTQLLPTFCVNSATYQNRVSNDFTPTTTGTYFFGIRSQGTASGEAVYIDAVRVFETVPSPPPLPTYYDLPDLSSFETNWNDWTIDNSLPNINFRDGWSTAGTPTGGGTIAAYAWTTDINAQQTSLIKYFNPAIDPSISFWYRTAISGSGANVFNGVRVFITPANDTEIELTAASLLPQGLQTENVWAQQTYDLSSYDTESDVWRVRFQLNTRRNEFSSLTRWSAVDLIDIQENLPLPISLLSFTARRLDNEKVMLNWTTANERNNHGFEVEMSENGKDFQKVGFVKGAGNSNSTQNYEFRIMNYNSAYYRLKQIDFDEQFTYSEIRFVEASVKEDLIAVYPNPFEDRIYLQVSQAEKPLQYHIVDATGKVIRNVDSGNAIQAENSMNEIFSQLPAGAYFLHIRNESINKQVKLIKLK